MGWRDHLQPEEQRTCTFPWLGGRRVRSATQAWRIDGVLPREFGWYEFGLSGRNATLVGPAEPDERYGSDRPYISGYAVGDRFIPENARVDPDPDKLVEQTEPIYLVQPGLDRFVKVRAARDPDLKLIYCEQLFDEGAEDDVRRAFVDREESLAKYKGVSPALDLAFRFASHQRLLYEARRAELERRRREEARREEARRNMGTAVGRRTLATTDFEAAAKAALSLSGAELLDVRDGYRRREAVVQYRFQNRRLECVVDRVTLRVIDSGICLTDHHTGEKGDTYFSLEALPGVVQEAIRGNKLVVYRHADGDPGDWNDDEWDD